MTTRVKHHFFIRRGRRKHNPREQGRELRWKVVGGVGDRTEIWTWTKRSAERIRGRLDRGLDPRVSDYF